MIVLMPIFSVLAVSRKPAWLNAISVICSLTPGLRAYGLTGFMGVGEQTHAVTVTTAKPVTAFRILPMRINAL